MDYSELLRQSIADRQTAELNSNRRHEFAKAAMQGMLARYFTAKPDPETVAELSVGFADALIAELDGTCK